jgi:1-deoxy-D-xylulose-5-phosphate synthase
LPNIVMMAPRDEAALVDMLHTSLVYDDGPVAIRYPRGEGVGVPLPTTPTAIDIGVGEVLTRGDGSVALLGYGSGVGLAQGAAQILAEAGISATVADARFAKPLDTELINELAAEHKLLVTLEEGVLSGGFGAGVLEHLADNGLPVQLLRVGLPDRYVTHGAPKLLHEEVGFTPDAVAKRVTDRLAKVSQVPRS